MLVLNFETVVDGDVLDGLVVVDVFSVCISPGNLLRLDTHRMDLLATLSNRQPLSLWLLSFSRSLLVGRGHCISPPGTSTDVLTTGASFLPFTRNPAYVHVFSTGPSSLGKLLLDDRPCQQAGFLSVTVTSSLCPSMSNQLDGIGLHLVCCHFYSPSKLS